ncbi:MAG: hypothetical protein L6R48_11535, partial [Planctomycetes bacterium]|nr:hypothetical protein [Planctomycetota bacterium]
AAAGAAAWQPVPAKAHPRWLECFDQAGPGVWVGGGGDQYVLPSDFQWLQQRGLAMCTLSPNESRLVGPGLLDTTIFDWHSAMAARHDLAYRVLYFPTSHPWLWNRSPLPYVLPEAGRSTVAPWLDYQVNTAAEAVEPVPAADPYVRDGRRRLAEHLVKDPNYVGMHGCTEIPEAGVDLLGAVARTPGVKQLWHAYLAGELGMDLARLGQAHAGDAGRYRSWDEVEVPGTIDFTGCDPAAGLDLRGTWELHEDVQAKGLAEGWQDPAKAPADWVAGDPGDPAILVYSPRRNTGNDKVQPDYWMRRTVNVPAGRAGALGYLHIARDVYHGNRTPTFAVWLNGRKLESLHEANAFSQCFATAGALVEGDNRLVLATHGAPLPGYCFLGDQPLRPYPHMGETLNRRWFDTVNFDAWLRVGKVEAALRATRAADPERPLKMMAMINLLDLTIPLCEKYGAYQHDTGGAGGYWCPMTGARLSRAHGLPWSCEQGGPPNSVEDLRASTTFYLMYGNDASDLVFGVGHYRDRPGVAEWFDENLELIRASGKLSLPQPPVGVLRSSRNTRMGFREPWNWDVARGPLQGVGRNFAYLELADMGAAPARPFPVVMDCGTVQVTPEEVEGILRYVREGGVFIAQHHTARHLPERADAWPLARAVGLGASARAVAGPDLHKWPLARIRFAADQDLVPSLRGKEVEGSGMAIDYLEQRHTGAVAFTGAGAGVRAVATWADGGMAVAEVRLGRGRLVLMGTPFTTRMRDSKGMWVNDAERSALLDELLAGCGAPRDSWAQGVWAERWRSKNGVYDLYPVARMERSGPATAAITAGAQVRRATAPARVVDIGAKGHPAVAASWKDGRLTLPAAGYLPMQARLYAAPAEDIARAGLAWFRVQADHWRALPPLPAIRRPAEVATPDDLLPLADGWTLAATGAATRSVALGAFATLGLPEDAVASFTRRVAVPAGWKGRRISLVFDAEHWFWGILPKGRLLVDGAEAFAKPIAPQANPGFALDVTAAAADGTLDLALTVDGSGAGMQRRKGDGLSKPHGVTGLFYLRAEPQPARIEPLATPWMVAAAVNRLQPVAVGDKAKGLYLENRFALPREWPAARVSLAAPVPLGFLIVNGTAIQCPAWMQRLDVSGLLRKDGGDNVIRWAPAARGVASWREPWQGVVPAMSLEWGG